MAAVEDVFTTDNPDVAMIAAALEIALGRPIGDENDADDIDSDPEVAVDIIIARFERAYRAISMVVREVAAEKKLDEFAEFDDV